MLLLMSNELERPSWVNFLGDLPTYARTASPKMTEFGMIIHWARYPCRGRARFRGLVNYQPKGVGAQRSKTFETSHHICSHHLNDTKADARSVCVSEPSFVTVASYQMQNASSPHAAGYRAFSWCAPHYRRVTFGLQRGVITVVALAVRYLTQG